MTQTETTTTVNTMTWDEAHDIAEAAAHAAYMAIPDAERHQDCTSPDAQLYRATVDGYTIVWGADYTDEGNPEPCVTWTQYEAEGDDLLADGGHHGDSECGADDLAARVEAAVRGRLTPTAP